MHQDKIMCPCYLCNNRFVGIGCGEKLERHEIPKIEAKPCP